MKSEMKPKLNWIKFLLWIGILGTTLFFVTPILWQILTSIKTNEAISAIPNIYLPSPDQLTLKHYQSLGLGFLRYGFNSALVSILSTLLCLGIGAPAAYSLTRLNIPGEKIILAFILVISLFPYVLLFLGLLEMVKALGLGNNYLALIVPYTAINLPLTILVLRSFFQQLPKDLEDSAKIDGYSTLGMLLNIILPMTVPALVTTGILTFIFAWNEFIFALTFITQESLYTIPVAVAQLGGTSVFEVPYGPMAAATIAGTVPLVILVLIFQRRIVQGITAGAVKG
ncbi:carbohydrate ABC transporter permease [Roseofilum capinflatum]|uniref:Carbohydrate ABC transporter permease n=1 Tax=Roseofilum capinflatum BLCC-M114 TaxID=3022440 RepID=A0ABT7B5D0_9CYAN|nr:carbohydrate ABC transporter permease [Roseofilum capinflatum]MDJ1173736.1 carbohydrate ABC transporter permease [Roseofilum capinflatum BLCC-M114]